MRRLFVFRRRIDIPIDFDEHESGRVIRLPDNIKAGDTRLPDTVTRVFPGGLFEGSDTFRLHANMHMDDQHGSFFDGPDAQCKPGLGELSPCRRARAVERSAQL